MSAAELDLIVKHLKISDFRDLIKKNGLTYRYLKLKDKNLSSEEMREVILENPKLLKRPIIVCEEKCLGIVAAKEEIVFNFLNEIK
jgi:arsenate reductase